LGNPDEEKGSFSRTFDFVKPDRAEREEDESLRLLMTLSFLLFNL
jgi:hypothetical protein